MELEKMRLNNLNMKYVSAEYNEEISGGAILECSRRWTVKKLESWLVGYSLDMINYVKRWLEGDCYIAEGLYLKVWVE